MAWIDSRVQLPSRGIVFEACFPIVLHEVEGWRRWQCSIRLADDTVRNIDSGAVAHRSINYFWRPQQDVPDCDARPVDS